jgi:hypothetical protein
MHALHWWNKMPHSVMHEPPCFDCHAYAAAEFGHIDKAYRVLLDAAAKGALDDWLKYVVLTRLELHAVSLCGAHIQYGMGGSIRMQILGKHALDDWTKYVWKGTCWIPYDSIPYCLHLNLQICMLLARI